MKPIIRWLAALVVPILLLSGPAVNAQKKEKGKKGEAEKEANSEKLIRAGVLTGKVAAVYEDKKKIRLSVTVPVTTINPGALNSIQQAQLNMMQARARGDAQGMINAQLEMARARATMYQVRNEHQDVELTAMDDVVVRTAHPKGSFDEKGKVKKMTKAELKELKGPDPKVPGYKAEFSDVQTEQVIQVTLVRKKNAPMPKVAVPKKKKKGEDGEAGADLFGDHLPQISLIMIVAEPPSSP